MILPLLQEIVVFFRAIVDGVGEADGEIVGAGDGLAMTFSCTNFVLIVGCENVKLFIER